MDNISPSSATPTAVPIASTEDKTVAIVAYLTLIGFIVAIVLHGNKKTQLGAYHLRQMLGLTVTSLGLWIVTAIISMIPIIGWIIGIILWLVTLALIIPWIFGLIAAINGQIKPVPVLGKHYEKWFGTTFQ